MLTDAHVLLLLNICYILFILRVVGQIYVYFKGPSWLPEFNDWYSGTISYKAVLGWQAYMVTLSTLGVIDMQYLYGLFNFRFFIVSSPYLIVLSYLYFGGMIFRYIWTMVRKPERRWFKGTIPIWAHMIFAAYCYSLATLILANYGGT